MMALIKRLLWPLRPRNTTEVRQFYDRMDRAKEYGEAQQQASVANIQAKVSRDLSTTMAIPPPWRKQGGGN